MTDTGTFRVYGATPSYYTGKLEAYLRYKGLAYEYVPMTDRIRRRMREEVGVAQAPALELPDGRWMTDTTPILAWLEGEYPEPVVIPRDPLQAFVSRVVEDYAEEWLWRPAMPLPLELPHRPHAPVAEAGGRARHRPPGPPVPEALRDPPTPAGPLREARRRVARHLGSRRGHLSEEPRPARGDLRRAPLPAGRGAEPGGLRLLRVDCSGTSRRTRRRATSCGCARRACTSGRRGCGTRRRSAWVRCCPASPTTGRRSCTRRADAYLPFLNANARAWTARAATFDVDIQGRALPQRADLAVPRLVPRRAAPSLRGAARGRAATRPARCSSATAATSPSSPEKVDSGYDPEGRVPFVGRAVHYHNAD